MECNTCKQSYVGYTTFNLPKRFLTIKAISRKVLGAVNKLIIFRYGSFFRSEARSYTWTYGCAKCLLYIDKCGFLSGWHFAIHLYMYFRVYLMPGYRRRVYMSIWNPGHLNGAWSILSLWDCGPVTPLESSDEMTVIKRWPTTKVCCAKLLSLLSKESE